MAYLKGLCQAHFNLETQNHRRFFRGGGNLRGHNAKFYSLFPAKLNKTIFEIHHKQIV